VKRLILAERGMDQKAEGASRFEHRAMARMLRKKWPLTLAAWPQANAGPARIGKEADLHFRIIQDRIKVPG
jgi:hypothetical protein